MRKTICFFGIYNPTYSRNEVLREGLETHGWRILDCLVDPQKYHGLKKYWKLSVLFSRMRKSADFVLVLYPGQSVLWLARLLAPGKKIIFDAFTSLYDSNVFDRQLYPAKSPLGFKDFFFDWLSWRLADINITDTKENLNYWQEKYSRRDHCLVVFVGSKIKAKSTLTRQPRLDNRFIVHFHGHYIPLQGVSYIIEAAKILADCKDIIFRVIGKGQEYEKVQRLTRKLGLSNVEFFPEMNYEKLKEKITEADIVLGIFGHTPKTARVIPNKVFEGLAMGKPVLTADTPAIAELLEDNINVSLCRQADPRSLAQKIVFLEKHEQLRKQIGQNGKHLYNERLRPGKIVEQLSSTLENYV